MTDYRKIPTKISGFIELKDETTPRKFHNKYRGYEIARNLMSPYKPSVPTKHFGISAELMFNMDEKFYDAVSADVDHGEFILQDEGSYELDKIVFENDSWYCMRGKMYFYKDINNLVDQLSPDTLYAAFHKQERENDISDIDSLIESNSISDEARILSYDDKDYIADQFRDSLEWDDSPMSRLIYTVDEFLDDPTLDPGKIYTVRYREKNGAEKACDITGVRTRRQLGANWNAFCENDGNIDDIIGYEERRMIEADIDDEYSFACYVKENILKYLPVGYEDATVCVKTIMRRNFVYNGISVQPHNDPIAPIINTDMFYADYADEPAKLDSIMMSIADAVIANEYSAEQKNILKKVGIYVFAMTNAFLRAVNKKSVPPTIPCKSIAGDIVAVVTIPCKKDDGTVCFVTVDDTLMAYYGIDEDKLFTTIEQLGEHNEYSTHVLESLSNMVNANGQHMFGVPRTTVLHNKNSLFGAGLIALPEILEDIGKTIAENYYILPSSVHEVIIMPESDVSCIMDIVKTVQYVNKCEVSPEDYLSDNVFYYDAASKTLESVI